MKIKQINIENFKFHHNLEFDIKTKNCLIYGENGTGKSSIYEALYSNFYYLKDKKIVNKQILIRDKFLHRDFLGDKLIVNTFFENAQSLTRENDVVTNHEILNDANIYFANEKILSNIVDGNFYDVINHNLFIHFPQLEVFSDVYSDLKEKLHDIPKDVELKDTGIIKERVEADSICKEQLANLIPLNDINNILKLKSNLECGFEIEFAFKDSTIDPDTYEFSNPIILIKVKGVEDRDDFKNHFNEAKLKLISIAIYFALAKKYETENDLKLLVLDDFLTSLDMSNRKRIARYILDNFANYQIIILTHNLQFFNLIKRLLDKEQWDIKILFTLREDLHIKTFAKDKNDNYIEEAKQFIYTENYDLHIAGNLLRKAFEDIIHEFEQLSELGKVETMQKIINAVKDNDKYFYNKPHDILEKLINDFESMFANTQQPDNAKIIQIKSKINQIKNNKITFLKKDEADTEYNIIKKTEFYKNILLNPSSHYDSESEVYKQECENTIVLLEELNTILESLKG